MHRQNGRKILENKYTHQHTTAQKSGVSKMIKRDSKAVY